MIVLGTIRKAKGYGCKRKMMEIEEVMVYVPLLDTLQKLLENDKVGAEVCTCNSC